MKNRIQDIETIQARTKYNFSISDCIDAYKENGENVNAAVDYLNSIKSGNEQTEEKKKNETRAAGALEGVFSALFLFSILALISLIIAAAVGSIKWVYISFPIGVMLFSFIMFNFANASKKKLEAQSCEEYLEDQEKQVSIAHDATVCPCCGSHEVQFFEPKFNKKKALLGTVVTGSLLGAYFGVPKDGVYKAVCNHCGHHWKAKIK